MPTQGIQLAHLFTDNPTLFRVLVEDRAADPNDRADIVNALVGVLVEIEGGCELVFADL